MKKIYWISIALVMISFPMENGVPMLASEVQAAEEQKERKTRRTPALRERVYSQLARAQKMADEGQVAEGLEILDRMKDRQNQLNDYERAMLWNFLAFIYYGQEDIAKAVDAFSKVIEQESIPESLEMSTLFSLAQLSMSLDKFQDTLKYLDRWETLATEKTNRNSAHTLRANAYYAAKQYPEALGAIDAAIAGVKEGVLPKENWLVLKRALHYELKQTNEVAKTTETLVRLYDDAKYWVELANLYGELGNEDLHLAVMEAAYQQGYIEKSRDFQTLAQLYFYAGAPYKSARLLATELEKGTISADLKILTFLAQSWEAAHEIPEAIEVLKQAATLSEDSSITERLARLYIDLENWNEALRYANEAEAFAGEIKNPGNVYIAKGIALLNLKRFDESITAFQQARDIKSTQRMANQWLRYAEKENELYTAVANAGASD